MTESEVTKVSMATSRIETIERDVVAVLKAKQVWLDWAEIFDAWRIVPRSIIYTYGAWTLWTCNRILTWYFALPVAQQTTQNAMLIGSLFTAATTLLNMAINFYQKSGRVWAGQPPP
jgi:hypothetical protein